MAEQVQSKQERERLNAVWLAHPKVRRFTADVAAFVSEAGQPPGGVDAAAMTAVLRFAAAWVAENGDLPDSGVKCS